MTMGVKCISQGKVRQLYASDNDAHKDQLLMVTSNRISAFDVVLDAEIPRKGEVLTSISIFWFKLLEKCGLLQGPLINKGVASKSSQVSSLPIDGSSAIRHHLITADVNEMPAVFKEFIQSSQSQSFEINPKSVMLVKKLNVIPFEAICRGYLAGSAYKDYFRSRSSQSGKSNADIPEEIRNLPDGLQLCDKLPEPLFTPSTKAEVGGKDINVSFSTMQRDVGAELAQRVKDAALKIYTAASEYALSKGIIIADTKFEFGVDPITQELYLVDEVLTPDSSRFWPLESYQPGRDQASFDKQFVRNYLTSVNFDKKTAIKLPQEVIEKTSEKYLQLLQILTL
ncbi:hypothetical protein MIR68_003697 [Amoeboaphelidium protococcarum]|nr:hypothetical protein MIR68_003697 [Amoeboaphelidium protococcarum]